MAAAVAEIAEIVRDVDEQRGAELPAGRVQRLQVRRVGIHREQALGDDQDRVLAIFLADVRQPAADGGDLEMAVEVDVLRRRRRAVLQAGMGESVDHDVVGGAHEAADSAGAGRVAGRIEQHVLHLEKLAKLALQRQRVRGVAHEGGRACAVDAIARDRLLRRLHHARMRGEAEIVLRAEVVAARAAPRVVGDRADGARPGRGRAGIRPQRLAPAGVLPSEEGLNARQHVGAGQQAEIAHAALQGLRQHLVRVRFRDHD